MVPRSDATPPTTLAVMEALEPRFEEASYPAHSYPETILGGVAVQGSFDQCNGGWWSMLTDDGDYRGTTKTLLRRRLKRRHRSCRIRLKTS